MTDTPQWALDRALEIANEGLSNPWVSECHTVAHNFAAYIAKHEEEPVDPDLEEARECAALLAESRGEHNCASIFRSGNWDYTQSVRAALIAIKRAKERQA